MKNSFLILFVTASLIASFVSSSSYIYSAYSVDDDLPYTCSGVGAPEGKVVCCDLDTSNGNMWCTTCDDTNPPSNCSQRELQMKEQPPTTDDQPTKSGDSVFPNEGKVLDEQQPKPKSPLTDQRALPGNEGVLEQSETSANNGDAENNPLNEAVLKE
ncbi:MAG: hypothetical protein L0H53_08165 [Candidatus Nitrosocosmicus sp.]|nr:hypothetical protein [Candidatus Nitrosocosmicus sp.]MDN5868683.1 hypothetical protein [Candidatus Nitrosocosmicus sp.]